MNISDRFDGCLVLHQDDIGMCHGANTAFVELSTRGSITSGSVMVSCPWFAEAAELAVATPSLDMGVHLTLTSEKSHYRWRPLIGAFKSSGLVDDDGYMWRDVPSVRRNADPRAAEEELRAQLERAYAIGIDVTHLDAHMGAALAPEFCSIYLALGAQYRLPVLITKRLSDYGPRKHLDGVDDVMFAPFVEEARRLGMPVFDRVLETDFGRQASQPLADRAYETMFEREASGLGFAALHPNAPGEVNVIELDQFHVRTDEYALFHSVPYNEWLHTASVRKIGMRELRDAMRGN